MAAPDFPFSPGTGREGAGSRFDAESYQDAKDHRSLATGLAGTSVAILTFVMFFLYDRWNTHQLNDLLFQWSIINILASLLLVSLAAMNSLFVMRALRSNHPQPEKYQRRAAGFFAGGWILLMFEPTLILVTVGVYVAALVALSFWLITLLLFGMGWGDSGKSDRAGAPGPRAVNPVQEEPNG
jgi:O-antigen/teichoic acid export membrane protein